MNLPPLPLIDGCLFVDNSLLEYLTTCPRALEYNFLRRRRLSEDRPALNFGGAIHAALEYRYRICPDLVDLEQQGEMILRAKPFLENIPIGEFRTWDLAAQLICRYNKVYLAEPFKVLYKDELLRGLRPMVEMPFAVRLSNFRRWSDGTYEPVGLEAVDTSAGGIAVYYTGKIDLVVSWDNQTFLIDHKTTSMLGPLFGEEQAMSAQHEGYAWALWKVTGDVPSGFCINAIRTRKPAKTVAAVVDDDFQRFKTYLSKERLEEWERNTIALVEEMLWHHSRDYMPQRRKWCVGKYGRCPYYDVCSLPAHNRKMMLESDAFTENTWSPLNKVS